MSTKQSGGWDGTMGMTSGDSSYSTGSFHLRNEQLEGVLRDGAPTRYWFSDYVHAEASSRTAAYRRDAAHGRAKSPALPCWRQPRSSPQAHCLCDSSAFLVRRFLLVCVVLSLFWCSCLFCRFPHTRTRSPSTDSRMRSATATASVPSVK